MRVAAAQRRRAPRERRIADPQSPDTCTLTADSLARPRLAPRATYAVEITSVSKLFGGLPVLREASARFLSSTCTVLLGANGSGKSTLLRLIAGLTQPTRGTITVFGSAPGDARGRIGYMAHSTMLYDELSAMENLEYFAALRKQEGCNCVASPEMALRAVNLDPALRRPVGQFSQGMRQRAAFAQVLQSDPDLLLLDEPFSNMDSATIDAMVALLADFRTWPTTTGAGRTIILTTHQPERARSIADRTLELSNGDLKTISQPAA